MSRRRNVRKKQFEPFASGFEFEINKEFKKHNKNIVFNVEYETETLTCIIIKEYKPDFIVTTQKGKKIYIETKGYFPYEDQQKMLGVKKANPRKDIRLLFQQDKPMRKGSKMKYSDWAKNNGFPFAIEHLPERWLK